MSRIELIGTRARYNLVGNQPAWVFHRMKPANEMTGVRPVYDSGVEADPDKNDPSLVRAGYAEFKGATGLELGGLFYHLAKNKRPIIIHSVEGASAITKASTVSFTDLSTEIRVITAEIQASPFSPIVLSPGEVLKIEGPLGTEFGVLASIKNDAEGQFL